MAQDAGTLAGWVNNAAVFGDAWLHAVPAREAVDLINANLALAVTGCATAVRRFLAGGAGGAIVNVSSHQAQRAVRGALPYATAKAAIEGLTRALAVDDGPRGIRVNAVALGSIATDRYQAFLAAQEPAAAARADDQMRALHPTGPGRAPARGRRHRPLPALRRGQLHQRRHRARRRWPLRPRARSRASMSVRIR
jgi:NAD(P)-dependent dehydrogenase (short-subunit alcohol dehydrogenase family)